MKDVNENAILQKSKFFAIRIIRLYQHLTETKNEYVMSKQLLRCGTSIGANVKEALRGQSRADFGAKLNISLKEASECEYWIELLHETDYITDQEFNSINSDCTDLLKILMSIVKTTFSSTQL
ncbi:MAG: four helix bundle protein [Bacteroidales bacterium]|nr:four helix bundle protein [Bacteroidales bacterium]